MMDEISNALRSLKMPGMAHYWTTMQETRQHDSLSLKDGLQLLIQAELDNRTTSRNTRLVKKARFRYQASIGEVIYDSKRGVDKQKVLNGQQPLDFMEIIEDRHGQKATIIISQLPVADWYDVMNGNTTAADAILDRLVHTSVRFELKGASLRQKNNQKYTESEKND